MKKIFAFIAIVTFVSVNAFAKEPSGWTKRFYLGADFSQQWAYYLPGSDNFSGATDMRGSLVLGYSFGQYCKCGITRVELVLGAGQYYQDPVVGMALLRMGESFEFNRFFCGPIFEVGCCFDNKGASVVFDAGVQVGCHLAEHWALTADAKICTLNILGGASLGTSVGIVCLF